jgi:uncharacterized protein involved in exopolysaccharide biosynthesis/Mrp family chromosome partitioning ATPase
MTDIFRARVTETHDSSEISEMARNAFAGLRRNLWLVMLFALGFSALTALYVVTRNDVYTSHASLIIDPRIGANGSAAQPSPGLFMADELVVDSEIGVLVSDRLLFRVAERLPVPERDEEAEAPGLLAQVMAFLAPDISSEAEVAEEQTEAQRLAEMVAWLRSRLQVEREGATFIITVAFQSQNPELSALVVNTVAEQYLALQNEEQVERATLATRWLSSESSRLSQLLMELETEVQTYRRENAIPDSENNSQVMQEIADVDRRSIAARSTIREAQSEIESIALDLERLKTPLEIGSLISLTLGGPQLEQLQDQLRNLQEDNAESNWDDSMTRVLDRVVAQISNELVRLRDTREALIAISKANLGTLERERLNLQQEVDRLGLVRIPLNLLERELGSLKNQHSVVSNRLRESEGSDRFVPSTARIIDVGKPAEQPRNNPKLAMIIAAAIGGAILGLGVVFVREQLDDRLRSSAQVIDTLRLPYAGFIPLLTGRRLKVSHAVTVPIDHAAYSLREKRQFLQLFAGNHHASAALRDNLRRAASLLSEGGRGTEMLPAGMTAFATSRRGNQPSLADGDNTVLRLHDGSVGPKGAAMITSPKTGDGKTTFATNLAVFLAERDIEVLLVDGDPHTATLSKLLAKQTKPPIESANELAKIVQLGPNLRVLVAKPTNQAGAIDPMRYIMAMKALLQDAATGQDVILVDAGPLTRTVEDLLRVPQLTRVFLTVCFGRVSASALRALLRQHPEIEKLVAGTFLTQVRENRVRQYEQLVD